MSSIYPPSTALAPANETDLDLDRLLRLFVGDFLIILVVEESAFATTEVFPPGFKGFVVGDLGIILSAPDFLSASILFELLALLSRVAFAGVVLEVISMDVPLTLMLLSLGLLVAGDSDISGKVCFLLVTE